jgi:hypothetical protein
MPKRGSSILDVIVVADDLVVTACCVGSITDAVEPVRSTYLFRS